MSIEQTKLWNPVLGSGRHGHLLLVTLWVTKREMSQILDISHNTTHSRNTFNVSLCSGFSLLTAWHPRVRLAHALITCGLGPVTALSSAVCSMIRAKLGLNNNTTWLYLWLNVITLIKTLTLIMRFFAWINVSVGEVETVASQVSFKIVNTQ